VPRAARLVLAALAAGACVAGVACGADGTDDRPPTEHVLLAAPDPHAPTQHGVFVDDPQGQIERIAAVDHLVAWSVRTPADRLREDDADLDVASPLRLPERCVDRGARHCTTQLVTLAVGPLRVVRRATGPSAVAGRIGGRRVIVGSHPGHGGGAGGCAPRLANLDGTARRSLPAVQFDGGLSTHCTRFDHAELHGRYAFAWIDGKAEEQDLTGLEGTTVAALDVDAGPRARWRAVQSPYRSSTGSTGWEIGPAVTESAMYWEELDDESNTITSLQLVALPRDLLHAPQPGTTPTTAAPITPNTTTACDLAATTDAVYELADARCRPLPDTGGPVGGAIHRITHPAFRPAGD
jgi:hypothetical protein